MIGNDQRRMHRTGGVNAAVRSVQVEQRTFARLSVSSCIDYNDVSVL